jgi:D-amino-acid dehydrogenase
MPERVIIVGAGIVGLSCAFSLQDYGIEVTVLDRKQPGAGSSWQNAGLLAPALTVPLPEPTILRYGLKALISPGSPVAIAGRLDPRLVRFASSLMRHCTTARWRRGMAAYRPLNEQVAESYEQQVSGGVRAEVTRSDILSCFAGDDQRHALVHELELLLSTSAPVKIDLLTGAEARQAEPHLSDQITAAVRIIGQQYITPSKYVTALADQVSRRGGRMIPRAEVTRVTRRSSLVVASGHEAEWEADAAVLATGAWLSKLARAHGVRVPVFGGRGYSFTVPCTPPLTAPVHFPAARVAATPQGGRLRVTGVMEFGAPDAPPRASRIEAVLQAVGPLLRDVGWEARADDWMGARPLSSDGVPLVGTSRTPGVYVAGGHGMWGVTLGPLTGSLLARQIATGEIPAELAPLDPCRHP